MFFLHVHVLFHSFFSIPFHMFFSFEITVHVSRCLCKIIYVMQEGVPIGQQNGTPWRYHCVLRRSMH